MIIDIKAREKGSGGNLWASIKWKGKIFLKNSSFEVFDLGFGID